MGLQPSLFSEILIDTTKQFVYRCVISRRLWVTTSEFFSMPKRKLPRPTDGELAILRVLWRRGPSTVREVHTEFNRVQETGYTTVLKLMQIMTEKGLVSRDESQKTHVCTAVLKEEEAQRQFVGDLLDRVFN